MKNKQLTKTENYWANCFSGERYGIESTKDIRSQFERDFDRIIFSSSFRRLQNKTQVFPLPKHVFVHNRLTHSLEVASVGRSLGQLIGEHIANLDEVKKNNYAVDFYNNHLKSVIAAAALAHDIGNPAFGHSGEEAISKYFIENNNPELKNLFTAEEWYDITHFEGNANALRILTKHSKGRLQGGFGLTYSTLASILKYPCSSTQSLGSKGPTHLKKYGFFQTENKAFSTIVEKTKMISDANNNGAFLRHPFVYLVEAADDICYNIIDFEDAHRLKILSTEEVKTTFLELIRIGETDTQKYTKLIGTCELLNDDPNELIAYLRAKSITYLINACSSEFINNLESISKGNYQGSLYGNLLAFKSILEKIEDVSYKKIYNHPSVAKIELAGFQIMSTLVEKFVEAALKPKEERIKREKKILELLPSQHGFNETDSAYQKVMCIIDYISGMSDLYALELYNNITGIQMPSF
jgi:dGTPase